MPDAYQETAFLRRLLDAVPVPMFLVTRGLKVLSANAAAADLCRAEPDISLERLCGEVLHCIHELESPAPCGETEHCPDCLVRGSVQQAWSEDRIVRQKQEMVVQVRGQRRVLYLSVTASPFEHAGERYVLLILADLTELTALRQIVPICAGCKKVRKDEAYWEQVESFVSRYTNVDFSHGFCPDCLKKYTDAGTR